MVEIEWWKSRVFGLSFYKRQFGSNQISFDWTRSYQMKQNIVIFNLHITNITNITNITKLVAQQSERSRECTCNSN